MEKRLCEICEIQAGGTPSRSNNEYWLGGGIPWVKISDIKGKYIDSTEEYITQLGLDNSSAKVFPKGTILYTIFATLGETGILSIDAATNQAIAGLRIVDEEVIPEYLYFFLCSLKDYVNNIGRGVAQNNINLGILRNLTISIPTKETQESIARKLNKVEELIALRKKQLQKLDDLVKARFVEMFEAGVFPSHDLFKLILDGTGLSYGIVQPGDDGTGDMGVLRPVDLVDGHISMKQIKYIDRSIGDSYQRTQLNGHELLITVRGTTGITALTDERFAGMNVTRGIAVIRYDEKKVNPVYLNCYLNTTESQRYIQEHTRGATLQQINIADLRVQKIPVPSMQMQERFAEFALQVDKSKLSIQQSLEKLETLKQSLMQQYFG